MAQVSYTVAPGHTVITTDGSYAPGDTVELPPDEAERLRAAGYLLLEDGSISVPSAPSPPGGGPTVVSAAPQQSTGDSAATTTATTADKAGAG